MLSRLPIVLGAALLAACSEPPRPPPRAEIRAAGGTFSVVPAAGQLPFCVLFEDRAAAVHPLVAGEDGQSISCPAGAPVGGKTFPPAQRDIYRVIVVFSDR